MNAFIYILLAIFVAFALYETVSLVRVVIKRIKSRSGKKSDDEDLSSENQEGNN